MTRIVDGESKPHRVYSRPLRRSQARRLAVQSMGNAVLWKHLLGELAKAVDAGERWDGREAFYAAVRAQHCATELYLRGEQVVLFDGQDYDRSDDPYDVSK
jgi:hypothetical protein